MAKQLQQGRITAEIVYETYSDNFGRTRTYGVSSLKGCFASAKNSCFHIILFDENGKQIGVDTVGDPSPAMQRLIERVKQEMYEDEPQEAATA